MADREPVTTKQEWKELAADPHLREDLGYDLVDWELIETQNGSEKVVVVPADEDAFPENAFVVVDEDAVCDLLDVR